MQISQVDKDKVISKQEDQKKSTKKAESIRPHSEKKCYIVPYSQGLCESYKTIYNKFGIQVHFKGGQTPRNLFISPKDKNTITKKKQCHILVQVHREVIQNLWRKIQRTFERNHLYLNIQVLLTTHQWRTSK